MRLSVVLPCRNAASTIGAQLEALTRQDLATEWDVVVVDNGSQDGTVGAAEAYADRLPLRIVRAVERASPAYARNRGVQEARGDALAFCDADDVVADDWLAEIAGALAQHELVASRAEYGLLNEPWTRAPRDEFVELPTLPFAPHRRFASSFGLGIRRDRHEQIGGFDEAVPGVEDVDYSIRAQLAGARLHYAPAAVVHYRNRDTLGGIYRQAFAYAEGMACLQRRYGDASTVSRLRWPLRGWATIARASARAHTRAGRARVAWSVGWQLGRLRGSVRHRVLAV